MKKTINWQTWACQLFFSYPLGDNSHFLDENFNQIDNEKLPIKPIVLPNISTPISDFSLAVKSSVDLLLESVESNLEQYRDCDPVVFLSGGWDSRAILSAVKRVRPDIKVKAFTTSYDSGNNQEERFASNVAKELNVPHQIIPLSKNYYKESAFEAIKSSGFSTKMHIWMRDFLRQVSLPKNTVNFDGYAGDLLFRGMRQEVGDEKLSPDDPVFFNRFAVLHPEKVLTGTVYKTMENLARRALADELSRYPAENRVLSFLLNNRGARGVAHSVGLQLEYFDVALPFLSEALLQNTVNIDTEIRLDKRLYPAILNSLNPKVAILPSTNSEHLPTDSYDETIQIKYQPDNLNWILSNIKKVASENELAGGLLDWYTLNPSKTLNQVRTGRDLQQYRRVMEMLNLYALWYDFTKEDIKPKQNILRDSFYFDPQKVIFLEQKQDDEFDKTIEKYSEKLKSLSNPATLLFNLTMDVEAFGIDDFYSNHSSHEFPVRRLVYSDFGNGSNIEKLFFKNRVPCTFFIESYSKEWQCEQSFSNAVQFFDKSYCEIGLHCHAFSLPESLKQELGLSFEWNMQHAQLSRVLKWGKHRLENARNRKMEVTSYRSGRLDIYPKMELALLNAGFKTDSSLLDGVESFYYERRPTNLGNGKFIYNDLTQVPISGFRAGTRVRSLDFNGATFEEICDVIVQSVKQGLPCLTMLMHSWSFSKLCQLNDFSKKLHYDTDPKLVLKFEKLLEFIDANSMIKLSTIKGTTEQIKTFPVATFPADRINTKPTLLEVISWREGENIYAKCIVDFVHVTEEIEYAYYLLHKGEKIDTQWYSNSPETHFKLEQPLLSEDIVVRGYVRKIGSNKPLVAKSAQVK